MMRIGLIVVGLCTLTIMELGTPARTKTSAPDPFEQLAVDVSVSRDTLKKADRLETHYLQHEVPVQPISPVEPASPPDVTAIIPEEDSNIVGRGTNDKKEVVRASVLSIAPVRRSADGRVMRDCLTHTGQYLPDEI